MFAYIVMACNLVSRYDLLYVRGRGRRRYYHQCISIEAYRELRLTCQTRSGRPAIIPAAVEFSQDRRTDYTPQTDAMGAALGGLEHVNWCEKY